MTRRERLIECLTFGRPDHYMFEHSYGLMPGTLDRWHGEGLPQDVDEEGVRAYFGFEEREPGLPVDMGLSPPFEPSESETEDGIVIRRDNLGVGRRLKRGITTLAIPFDFPVRGPKGWEDYRWRLQYRPERIGDDLEERYREQRRLGLPTCVAWTGFYWFPRDLMGDEGLCLSYYTQPELVKDILQTYSDMIFAVSEQLLSRVEVDVMHMGEDMCYRNAMMVSPATFREFMTPHYRRMVGLYRSHGTRVFSVDTDGHLGQIIPLLIEAGINVVTPCEVRAGNDVVALRRQYGRQMAFTRGLNKLALADPPTPLLPEGRPGGLTTREAIDRELEYRLPPMLAGGGYIAGLDHRVVPQTSLAAFTHYVRRVREMLGMSLDVPALCGPEPAWS